jgi:hypothetical protein
MTQSQIIEHLAKTIGISKKDAKLALDELNTLMVRELKKEDSIRLAACIARFAACSQSLAATPYYSKPSHLVPAASAAHYHREKSVTSGSIREPQIAQRYRRFVSPPLANDSVSLLP